MADNTVTVVGNVTRDPELRFTPSGQAVATFGLAVNRRWQNRQTNEWEEQTSFFDVTCWAQMAENVGESLHEGRPRRRHRPPRAALVGDPGRREALEGRDRRRRDRPEPALGHRRGRRKNERRERRRRRSAVAAAAAARPAASDARPTAGVRQRRGALLMAQESRKRGKNKDNARRARRRSSVLAQESVEYVDYKDVNLLRRFMSDRAKIRARRVTGNDAQQQREVARAIKNAREMALLPYTNRVTTQQRGGRDRGDRGDRAIRADGPPPRPTAPPPAPMRRSDELAPTTRSSSRRLVDGSPRSRR